MDRVLLIGLEALVGGPGFEVHHADYEAAPSACSAVHPRAVLIDARRNLRQALRASKAISRLGSERPVILLLSPEKYLESLDRDPGRRLHHADRVADAGMELPAVLQLVHSTPRRAPPSVNPNPIRAGTIVGLALAFYVGGPVIRWISGFGIALVLASSVLAGREFRKGRPAA